MVIPDLRTRLLVSQAGSGLDPGQCELVPELLVPSHVLSPVQEFQGLAMVPLRTGQTRQTQ